MIMNAKLDPNDELLAEFINESREHLTTIETDLLAIEEGGADIDAELVNKVFRAVLGDGSVALILDVAGLAAKAKLDTVTGASHSNAETENAELEQATGLHSLVLFRNAPDVLCALPLDSPAAPWP